MTPWSTPSLPGRRVPSMFISSDSPISKHTPARWLLEPPVTPPPPINNSSISFLVSLRVPSCPFVVLRAPSWISFFWALVDNPLNWFQASPAPAPHDGADHSRVKQVLFQASRPPARAGGSYEEKQPIVDEDEPRMDTNKHK